MRRPRRSPARCTSGARPHSSTRRPCAGRARSLAPPAPCGERAHPPARHRMSRGAAAAGPLESAQLNEHIRPLRGFPRSWPPAHPCRTPPQSTDPPPRARREDGVVGAVQEEPRHVGTSPQAHARGKAGNGNGLGGGNDSRGPRTRSWTLGGAPQSGPKVRREGRSGRTSALQARSKLGIGGTGAMSARAPSCRSSGGERAMARPAPAAGRPENHKLSSSEL